MEYKEQIEELRTLSKHGPEQMGDDGGKDPLEKAADSIETLLVELNEHKNRCCNNCEYRGKSWHCRYCFRKGGSSDLWELTRETEHEGKP